MTGILGISDPTESNLPIRALDGNQSGSHRQRHLQWMDDELVGVMITKQKMVGNEPWTIRKKKKQQKQDLS